LRARASSITTAMRIRSVAARAPIDLVLATEFIYCLADINRS
jgi:hypothetical protein